MHRTKIQSQVISEAPTPPPSSRQNKMIYLLNVCCERIFRIFGSSSYVKYKATDIVFSGIYPLETILYKRAF